MRFTFVIFFIITLLFGTSYWYLEAAATCPVPITYRLGELDERFNLSAEDAKSIIEEATNVWERPLERELFVYDENSSFPINFIFDERQQMAVTEEEWRMRLDEKEKSSQKLIEEVKSMSGEYENLQKLYAKDRERYETRLSAYNKEVERYNQQGGAPEDVFKELQAEKKELAEMFRQLDGAGKDLNSLADTLNGLGEEGNIAVDEYNKEVIEYNEIFGETNLFTQGDFRRDRINVYKFSSAEELTRVLAHEFGHALGIGHVEGESSVMYYLTKEQSGRPSLSGQDVTDFREHCGDGTEFSHVARNFVRGFLAKF